MDVTAGLPFEAVLESGLTGLVPGIELAIIDNLGATVTAASTAGIAEQIVDGEATGIYAVTKTAPAATGQFTLVWSTDGSFDPHTVTVEDLVVHAAGVILDPIGGVGEGAYAGPCSLWVDIDTIASCCTIPADLDQMELIALLTGAATAASELLYWTSGRQFAGSCQRTVYPDADDCACGYQVLSRGYVVHNGEGAHCGCSVKLAGSVREVSEVMIDGVVVDPSAYEVRGRRSLERIDGSHWPCCQQPCEPRTFSVTYSYGKTIPSSGTRAARQLACEIFKSCTGAEDCNLPTGVTRVTRAGITFERSFLSRDDKGIWRSGLAEVDLFLNAVNPAGLQRRGTFWSPSRRARYARG